jgi:hypothetical protein
MLRWERGCLLETSLWVSLGIILVSGAPASAGALIFSNTFDASFATNFGANAPAAQSAVLYAESVFSSTYNNNITINLIFNGVASGPPGFTGRSDAIVPYAGAGGWRTALAADATSMDDATSLGPVGSLPASDPVSGLHVWFIATAQEKALGLLSGTDTNNNASISFDSSFSWTFDPANRAVPGSIDFIGVAMHEISEAMGRSRFCGFKPSGNLADNGIVDAFSYMGSGTRNLGAGGSFSIDNGATPLTAFNTNFSTGGDCGDWASGQGNDSFNAFPSAGVVLSFSATDIRELDVLGYNLATPEPDAVLTVLSGLCFLGLIRRWRYFTQGQPPR